jgi:IclR family transcriptional regulator, KDG regulon repressor
MFRYLFNTWILYPITEPSRCWEPMLTYIVNSFSINNETAFQKRTGVVKVLQNAFLILDLFLRHGSEKSLEELTQLSGLNKTTVSRIVSALVKHGYLAQKGKRSKYSLGFKFFDFTGYIKNQIKVRDVAIPFLMKLTQDLNESVIMAIWDGGTAFITETFQAKNPLKVVPDEGASLALHSTSLGKSILANISPREFEIIGRNHTFERFTPNTITDLQDLKNHLIIVKREGIAFDDEENILGVRGVAAGLRNFDGSVVGAVGVIGPSVRLTRARMRECVEPVKTCAMEISKSMGYSNNGRNSFIKY